MIVILFRLRGHSSRLTIVKDKKKRLFGRFSRLFSGSNRLRKFAFKNPQKLIDKTTSVEQASVRETKLDLAARRLTHNGELIQFPSAEFKLFVILRTVPKV